MEDFHYDLKKQNTEIIDLYEASKGYIDYVKAITCLVVASLPELSEKEEKKICEMIKARIGSLNPRITSLYDHFKDDIKEVAGVSAISLKDVEIPEEYCVLRENTIDDWKNYVLHLTDSLDRFIITKIKQSGFDKAVDFTVLMQEGKYGIALAAYDYDPNKSMPTSFFDFKVKDALKGAVKEEAKFSTHYLQILATLRKVAAEAGYDDIYSVPVPKLIELCGGKIAPRSVHGALELGKSKEVELDETIASDMLSPESAYIKRETEIEVANALSQLEPFEKACVTLLLISEKHYTYNDVVKHFADMSEEELSRIYNLKKVPDVAAVRQAFGKGKRQLKHILSNRGTSEKLAYEFTEVEQASPSEILGAFELTSISV